MARSQRTKKLLQVLSRSLLASLLLIVWFAPAASAETVCEATETGWDCDIVVETFDDGPQFTFVLQEETQVTVRTFTSLTCDDWETGEGTDLYAADPVLHLYDDEDTLLQTDDDSAEHNNDINFCWDALIITTLPAGSYVLQANAYNQATIGVYSLEIFGGEWTVPQEEPEPTPTPVPELTPSPTPTSTPEPTPTLTPTPQPPTPTPTMPPRVAPTAQPTPTVLIEEFPYEEDIIWDDLDLGDYEDFEWDFEEEEIEEIYEEEEEFLFEDFEDTLPEIEEEFEEYDEEPLEFEEEEDVELEEEELEEEFILDPEMDIEQVDFEELDVEDLLDENSDVLDQILESEEDIEEFLEEVIEDNPDFFEEAETSELEAVFEVAPEIFNSASDDIKNEFEEETNIFEGGFEGYVAEDSTVTVEERRVIVAATTVSAMAAARPAIQARPKIAPTSTSGPSISQRRRRT